jgi:chitosanase
MSLTPDRRFRPVLETLEDRRLLSATLPTSGGLQAKLQDAIAALAHVARPDALAPSGLTRVQKRRAEALTSIFENDTPKLQYAYAEALDDGRGITAGRAGFTTGTGDALLVVTRYTSRVPSNPLASFLPVLRRLAAAESGATDELTGFSEAWKQAAGDARFRAAQDQVSDLLYYRPAVVQARKLGIQNPLSLAVLYDTIIQHGNGTDPDGLPALIKRTNQRARGTPRGGVEEDFWLATFLVVRRQDLLRAFNPETRAEWRASARRVDALQALLSAGNLTLDGPIVVNTRPYTRYRIL